LLVGATDLMELRERAAGLLEAVGGEAICRDHMAVDPAIERHPLAADLAIEATVAIGDRLRTCEAGFAGEEQEVDLALHVELALHLVDAQQMLAARGLEHEVGVDRAGRDPTRAGQTDESVVADDLVEHRALEYRVHRHPPKLRRVPNP